MIGQTAEAASQVASKAMYAGAGTTVASWLSCRFEMTGDDWTVLFGLIGAVVAVAGLIANIWFKHQHLKIARAKAQADPEA